METLDRLEILNLNGNPIMKDEETRSLLYKRLPKVELLEDESENYENAMQSDEEVEGSEHLQKLYELAEEMNITDIEEFKQLGMKVSCDWNEKLLNEPDDYELLTYSIKTSEKQKVRPKTAITRQKKGESEMLENVRTLIHSPF